MPHSGLGIPGITRCKLGARAGNRTQICNLEGSRRIRWSTLAKLVTHLPPQPAPQQCQRLLITAPRMLSDLHLEQIIMPPLLRPDYREFWLAVAFIEPFQNPELKRSFDGNGFGWHKRE